MAILIYWREIAIAALIALCLWLFNLNQDARYEAKETQLIHEKLIAEAESARLTSIANHSRQRQIEAEEYANQINIINGKYIGLMRSNDRMRTEIKTYSDRLHTVSREAVENYAKAASAIYAECRSEYIQMGQYAAKIDAELDKTTKSPQ
jgi:hypothetical protein